VPTELAVILATIRYMESGGDYTVEARGSTASGAYGFLDSSWGGYGGYARAKDAPPAVQDAKAAELVAQILTRNGGDVSTVPVTWYIGHVPVGDEWDTVPKPEAGNRITPREYQRRWMNRYRELLGRPEAVVTDAAATPATEEPLPPCRTVVIDVGTRSVPGTSSPSAGRSWRIPTVVPCRMPSTAAGRGASHTRTSRSGCEIDVAGGVDRPPPRRRHHLGGDARSGFAQEPGADAVGHVGVGAGDVVGDVGDAHGGELVAPRLLGAVHGGGDLARGAAVPA